MGHTVGRRQPATNDQMVYYDQKHTMSEATQTQSNTQVRGARHGWRDSENLAHPAVPQSLHE